MTQDFDPTAVKRAAMKYRQLASDIQIRVEAIAGRLNECGGMAGNDNGAKDFCQHYDPAAKDGIEAGAYAVNALNNGRSTIDYLRMIGDEDKRAPFADLL